jgi:P27 family predicted phage terminase small subunit
MAGGRPPKPLEQRRRTGRSSTRDSGGRKLPSGATVTALPGADAIPTLPAELVTTPNADSCPFRARPVATRFGADGSALDVELEELSPGEPCAVCLAEFGRESWDRLWTAGRSWLSPTTDLDVLIRLCKAKVEEAHHRDALGADGYYVAGQRGGLVAHPAVRMLRTLTAEITRLESLCGFTPSDRGRLGVGEVKRGASPLEKLLEKRTGTAGPKRSS